MHIKFIRTDSPDNRDEQALLEWVEAELAYHEEGLEAAAEYVSLKIDPPERDENHNNAVRMHTDGFNRLTQIKAALISGSVLRYWSATQADEVPEHIKERKDWPGQLGVNARDHWAKVPVVI